MKLMKDRLAAITLAVLVGTLVSGTALADGGGRYLKHNYTYTQKAGTTATIFKPVLPRDDTVLIGAMLEVVMQVYGKHQIANLKPTLVSRNGRNLIRFNGVGYDYFFLLIKEVSGEVNGFSMWREKA